MDKKLIFIIYALAGIFIGVGLFLFGGNSEMKSFDAVLEIGDSPAVNNDITYFDFGSVPKSGGIVNKFIDINAGKSSQKIHVEARGDIANFIYVSDNDFVVGTEEFKTLTIRAVIPNGTRVGTYEGEINFYYFENEV